MLITVLPPMTRPFITMYLVVSSLPALYVVIGLAIWSTLWRCTLWAGSWDPDVKHYHLVMCGLRNKLMCLSKPVEVTNNS